MNHSKFQELLDAYVDGELSKDRREEIERYLETHPEERVAVEETRLLKRTTGELPREIQPSRDLWAGIRAELESVGQERERLLPIRLRRPVAFWWASLAASLLILLSGAMALILWKTENGSSEPRVASVDVSGDLARIEFRAAEEEYLQVTQQLLTTLEERQEQLSPETLKVLEENLRIINEAIEEISAALDADPRNPVHGYSLTAMYRLKMHILWRASQIS